MVRESEDSLLGRHRRNGKSATRGRQIGLLEVLAYLTAIVVVVGSVVRGWDFNLLIALIMLVVAYAVFRDLGTLSRLEAQNEKTQSSEPMMPLRMSSRGGSLPQQPPRMFGQQGEMKKAQDPAGWACSPQQTRQKGTTHEPNGFSKA